MDDPNCTGWGCRVGAGGWALNAALPSLFSSTRYQKHQ